MRKAQSNENVLGHIISKKFLLLFIHSLAQRYAHLHRWSQSAWSSKCWSWQGWADMWRSCIQCREHVRTSIMIHTMWFSENPNNIWNRLLTYWQSILTTMSPFLGGIGISKKSILTSVNRQKCVSWFVNMGEYGKTSGSQKDATATTCVVCSSWRQSLSRGDRYCCHSHHQSHV